MRFVAYSHLRLRLIASFLSQPGGIHYAKSDPSNLCQVPSYRRHIRSRTIRKLRKLFRMQYSRQNFDAVDNARPWPCEVSTRIDEINVAAARRWKRIESRKFFQQFVIAARKIDIIATEREHDNVRARIQHLLPIDLRRRLMLAA